MSPFISKQAKSAKAQSEKHAPKMLYLETGWSVFNIPVSAYPILHVWTGVRLN